MITYNFILNRVETISPQLLHQLLQQHEIACLARMIKEKFKDQRPPTVLAEIICDELGLKILKKL